MTTKHVHKFKLKINRVRADNKLYNGTTGDKAIISWVCACKAAYAVEMGPVRAMAKLFKRLTNVPRTENNPSS